MNLDLSKTKLKGKANPRLLLHPQIPLPMSGVAPRVILGQEWWDKERHAAFKAANYCCEACGVSGPEAKFHPRLEGHETYLIDFHKARMKYTGAVALCHACHMFIHKGRFAKLVERKLETKTKLRTILSHGNRLIKHLHQPINYPSTLLKPKWSDWRLELDGTLHPPRYKSYEEWLELASHELSE